MHSDILDHKNKPLARFVLFSAPATPDPEPKNSPENDNIVTQQNINRQGRIQGTKKK
jgi:hypothetical protein